MDKFTLKRNSIRNNEYYNMQNTFDNLYQKSVRNEKFTKLYEIMKSESNIKLAYRNIKRNKGSVTPGTDKLNIDFIKQMGLDEYVNRIQNKMENYQPKKVRRVEIPKPNGKTRPLGIPCIDDRIIQQCIKQVLEPICEAKFYNHSYGFRPNRSTKNAISRAMHLVNINKLHYVVDIDIKGFFDNIDHGKLLKQIWNMGIQDKRVISILSKILKSEIEGIGKSDKGTPQGGIISPLLSNIVLNEMDWWIANQWETFETRHEYSRKHKYRAMRSTKLKEVWLVRYADDFKIFCRKPKDAFKIYNATTKWLRERLNLEISQEKSKVTNIRRNYSEFLGIKFCGKVKKKKGNKDKFVFHSRMSSKSFKYSYETLKNQVKNMKSNLNRDEVRRINSMILGMHNYFNIAAYIVKDMGKMDWKIRKLIYHKWKIKAHDGKFFKSKVLEEVYKDYLHNPNKIIIDGMMVFPIYGCKHKTSMNFNQKTCNYTIEGRELIHRNIDYVKHLTIHLLRCRENKRKSVEYYDNRISKMSEQNGKCFITKNNLEIGDMECHHKTPIKKGGTDDYKNLVWVSLSMHKLIHATKTETINKYVGNLDGKMLKRINVLRKLVGNLEI